ncbi:MAG: hydrogenase maturation nickel metallochaperone HypA [Candidatus Aminicenantes bacterium]|nr:hydrogenase maturation nickel metallochaperone HypA [Candidatus Aminicenantes bacterium]
MHELSVVASLFDILEEKLKEQKGSKVFYVKLQVGLFSGVVPELLKTAFDMYKKGTFAEEAELDIQEIPYKVQCLACGTSMIKDDFVLVCDNCGSTDLKNLEGTEMLLERMEIEVPDRSS